MGGCLAVPIDHTGKHGAKLLPLYIPQQYAVAEQKLLQKNGFVRKTPFQNRNDYNRCGTDNFNGIDGNTVAERKYCCGTEMLLQK